jgi:hypothetical protein
MATPTLLSGVITLNGVPQIGVSVTIGNVTRGGSDTITTNSSGYSYADLANLPNGYVAGNIIRVSYLYNQTEFVPTYGTANTKNLVIFVPALQALKKAIYRSIPKTANVGIDTLPIAVEYADRMIKAPAKTSYPYLTLSYFADGKDIRASSANQLMETELVDNADGYHDTKLTMGKRNRITLSIQCRAMDSGVNSKNDILEQMLSDLQIWAMRDLPDALSPFGAVVIEDMPIQRLNFNQGEEIVHAAYDIIIRYPVTYQIVVGTIETMDTTVNIP